MFVILIGLAMRSDLVNDIHRTISASTNVMIFISGGATILEGFPKVINPSSYVQSHTPVRLRESFKCFIVQERKKDVSPCEQCTLRQLREKYLPGKQSNGPRGNE